MFEFEHSALKKMNYDLKSRQHKNQTVTDDNKRDKEIMDKVFNQCYDMQINIGLQNTILKLDDKSKVQ